jgi:hypothetical protein
MIFGRSKKTKDEEVVEETLDDQAEEVLRSIEEIEAEKEAKRFAREEKKFLKAHRKKQEQREKLVAPILLILTVLISYFLYWLSQR